MYLILGNGNIPIPNELWLNTKYISVNNDLNYTPHIFYDIHNLPWTFAIDNAFEGIIDTSGIILRDHKKSKFLEEVQRILKPGGTFYSYDIILFENTPLKKLFTLRK